jgi:hypothetical protein
MRRTPVRLAASAALGVVTSVGLAWGQAARPRMQGSMPFTAIGEGMNRGMVARESAFGVQRWSITMSMTLVSGSSNDRSADEFINAAVRKTLSESLRDGTFPAWWGTKPDDRERSKGELWAGSTQAAYGWPLPALWCEWRQVLNGLRQVVGWQGLPIVPAPEGGLDLTPSPSEVSMGADPYRALPWRPVWLGLAGDTVCFGSVWFAVLVLPGARRRFRLRRGLCAACGYDLAGNTMGVCPECGAGATS